MKLKLIALITIILFMGNSIALENKILFKINNEIVSTIDLFNESKYLTLLNTNLANLEKNKIYEISKNSLIREKIKKIELLKNYKNLDIDQKYFDQLMNNYSKKMGFNTIKEFETHIKANELNIESVKKK